MQSETENKDKRQIQRSAKLSRFPKFNFFQKSQQTIIADGEA